MTWLTVREASSFCGVTDSAIKKAIQQNRYQHRYVNGKGRGGKQLRIALESLPEGAQARYRGEIPPPVDILQFTGKQRDEANAKAWVVEQYQREGLSPDDFVSWFNSNNPTEDAITKSKLFRWQHKYQGKNVAGLIDRRGGHNRGQDTIPEDAWQVFYSLYMIQQKRSVRLCYDITKKGRVPQRIYGYDRIDNYTLQVNPVEANVVRRIFYLYLNEGMGCGASVWR